MIYQCFKVILFKYFYKECFLSVIIIKIIELIYQYVLLKCYVHALIQHTYTHRHYILLGFRSLNLQCVKIRRLFITSMVYIVWRSANSNIEHQSPLFLSRHVPWEILQLERIGRFVVNCHTCELGQLYRILWRFSTQFHSKLYYLKIDVKKSVVKKNIQYTILSKQEKITSF